MQVEFVEAAEPDGVEDAMPDEARAPVGRRLLLAGIAVVVVVAGVATTLRQQSHGGSPTAVDGTHQMIDYIAQTAARATVDNDVVVVSGVGGAPCTALGVGQVPQQRALDAVQAVLPAYRLVDYSRTLDLSAGLCALQLRARNPSGVVVVLQSVPRALRARAGAAHTAVRTGPPGKVRTEYAQVDDSSGWEVTVGATGRSGHLPDTAQLTRVARDSRLRWSG